MNKTAWHEQMQILILPPPPLMERQAVWFRLLVAIANCGTFSKKNWVKTKN